MAIAVLFDPFLSLNAVDLSDHAKQVTLDYTAEELDSTAGGDTTRERTPGLKDWSISADIEQDYAGGSVDATLFGLIGAAAFAIDVRPVKTGGRSVTNPSFTGNAVLESYRPMGGQHGQLHMTQVSLKGSGALSRLTA